MKKGIITFLVIIAIVSSSFSTEAVELEPQLEKRLITDLMMYVHKSEMMFSDILWVLDYFDRFDKARDWKSLQLARVSLSIAKSYISTDKLPSREMTANDYRELMRRKLDLGFNDLEAMFQGTQRMLINTCNNFSYSIMVGMFLKRDWDIRKRHYENAKQTMECEIQYLADTVDYMISVLDNPATTKKLMGLLNEYCPKTYAHMRKEPDTVKSIEEALKKDLDQLHDLAVDGTEILGAGTNMLNAFTDAIDREYLDKFLDREIMRISDVPVVVLWPSWLNYRDSIFYYFKEEGKIVRSPSPLSEISRIPDGCVIRTTNVSLSQVKEYQNDLKLLGLSCFSSDDKDGEYFIGYRVGGSEFAILWKDGEVTIAMNKNPVLFVPANYFLKFIEKAGNIPGIK